MKGYDIIDQKYVINEHEAQAVHLIFGMYASGSSYSDIFTLLHEKRYKGKRGKKIGKTALHEILKNERYIGIYT